MIVPSPCAGANWPDVDAVVAVILSDIVMPVALVHTYAFALQLMQVEIVVRLSGLLNELSLDISGIEEL